MLPLLWTLVCIKNCQPKSCLIASQMDSQTASPIVEILTKVLTPKKKPKLFEQVYDGYRTPVRVV